MKMQHVHVPIRMRTKLDRVPNTYMCVKCGVRYPETETWIEIDPRNQKRVRVCETCVATAKRVQQPQMMVMNFRERCATLSIIPLPDRGMVFECVYHLFRYTRRERAYMKFDTAWVREAFQSMLFMRDEMEGVATETYMDIDTGCNQ